MTVYGVFEKRDECGGWHLLKVYATREQADRHLGHERITHGPVKAAQRYRVTDIDVEGG